MISNKQGSDSAFGLDIYDQYSNHEHCFSRLGDSEGVVCVIDMETKNCKMNNKISILQNNEHGRVEGSCNVLDQFSRVLSFSDLSR